MAYSEEKVVDRIEVLEQGQIQVRLATKVYKDGVEIAKTYERYVIAPGDTISLNEDPKVKAIAKIIHTKEVVDKYKAKILTQLPIKE